MSGLRTDVYGEWKCLRVTLYFRCTFVGGMIRVKGGFPLLAEVRMNGIEVVVYLGMPIQEVLCHRRCRRKSRCIAKSMPSSMEPPELVMVGEVENTMCSRIDSYFKCVSVGEATWSREGILPWP
ncbi:hypothetical protein TIFTF001_016596 [Ficus carica]|uniref:Uncharacterized protein n=1 Tax=Ficus carica TaxID=3494 RepID=A0AA88DA03_FICCA|nr:hypothetical protein TIFTF001_016596 [Ficus carica]